MPSTHGLAEEVTNGRVDGGVRVEDGSDPHRHGRSPLRFWWTVLQGTRR